MSKAIRALSSLLLLLLLAAFIGCEGDEGPQGPAGNDGDQGPAGEPGDIAPPGDQYFGISIANNSIYHQNGAPLIRLTFDSTATPSDELVVGKRLSQPPQLDAQVRDDPAWQVTEASTIFLETVRGLDNEIYSVDIRAGFDDDYVYFMFLWTEADPDTTLFERRIDYLPGRWVYDDDESVWNRTTMDEDQCLLFWAIDDVDGWSTTGADMLYHGDDSTLYLDGTGLIDVWHFSAGKGGVIGYIGDMYIDGSQNEGAPMYDQGTSAYIENVAGDHPRWQHLDDPNSNSLPPFMQWETVIFDLTDEWEDNSKILGYTAVYPTGSQADIEFSGTIRAWTPKEAPDSWILEIRRERNTGNGDDVQF